MVQEHMVDRLRLPDSVVDKLYFAQVREDPVLEIEALGPGPGRTMVVVGSQAVAILQPSPRGMMRKPTITYGIPLCG